MYYANCGHPLPLLLSAQGDKVAVERLISTSTVIGLFSDFDCQVAEKQLSPGDTIIAYSDGVTEAENREGEQFGEDRLLELARARRHLPAPLLLEKLVEGVNLFSSPKQADDITVLAVRCRA